jgi:hypothetical protein
MAVANHERVGRLTNQRSQCVRLNVHRSRLIDDDYSPVTRHLMSEGTALIVGEEPTWITHGRARRARSPRSITLSAWRAFEEGRLVHHERGKDTRRRTPSTDRERATKRSKLLGTGRHASGR